MPTQQSVATYYDAIEFFYRKPWSDGYPVVPPTKELIASMLRGTRRDPDEEIGVVPPNLETLDATRE